MPKTDVYIYGSIGKPWWADEDYDGVNEKDVLDALNSLDKADVHNVHFNTAGGVVKTGIGIMNIMREHITRQRLTNSKFNLRTVNDGICYSAGSYPFLTGNIRVMNMGSQILVHRCSSWAEGNADEIENVVTELRTLDESLSNLYSNMLGQTPEHWANLMALDEVVNGDRAVELGLATAHDTTMHAAATNFSTAFSPENIKKDGYRRTYERNFHLCNAVKKGDLLTAPSVTTTPSRKASLNTRLLQARMNSAIARLPK